MLLEFDYSRRNTAKTFSIYLYSCHIINTFLLANIQISPDTAKAAWRIMMPFIYGKIFPRVTVSTMPRHARYDRKAIHRPWLP